MLVKVSGKPVTSLMSQGFTVRKIKGEDYLAKNGKYFHCPRSLKRAMNKSVSGKTVEPFKFLLNEVYPTIDNLDRGKPKIDETVTLHMNPNKPEGTYWTSYVNNPPTKKCCQVKSQPQPAKMPLNQAKFILTGNVVTFFFNGVSHSSSKANPMFDKIVEHLKAGDMKKASELVNIANAIDIASQGLIKNDGGVLKYNGSNLNETAEEWIIRNMDKGMTAIQPIVNFLARVKANPHSQSVEGLWRFIKECGLLVTKDGKFIGYKYVDNDLMDSHTRTLHYGLGKTVEMPRDKVEFNPNVSCSAGLHVGSMSYIGNKSTVLELIVDPIDVVSVPVDYKSGKMRCCKVYVHKILKQNGAQVNQPTKQEDLFDLN